MLRLVTCLALAVSLLLFSAGCSNDAELWVGYGGSGNRSLSAEQRGPARPKLLWVTDLNAHNPGSPVVGETGIYIPHCGGSVTKVDFGGAIQWRFDSWLNSNNVLPELHLLPQERVLLYVAGNTDFLLDKDGARLDAPWLPLPASTSLASNSSGYTVVCHQLVHGGGAALKIYGLIKGGSVLWQHDFVDPVQSYFASIPVVLEDGSAYVFVETQGDRNLLLALGAAGEILWQKELDSAATKGVDMAIAATEQGLTIFGTPRIEDIWQVYSPGYLFAVDAQGQLLWQVEAGQRVAQILLASDMVVANLLRTQLLALDLAGQVLWEYALEGWESNAVLDGGGTTYIAGVHQGEICLKAISSHGQEVWSWASGEKAESISYLALANGTLYLVCQQGRLLAIGE